MVLQKLQEKIDNLINSDPDNSFQGQWRFYDLPLFGVARADGSLFIKVKEEKIVGGHLLLPEEWLPGIFP